MVEDSAHSKALDDIAAIQLASAEGHASEKPVKVDEAFSNAVFRGPNVEGQTVSRRHSNAGKDQA